MGSQSTTVGDDDDDGAGPDEQASEHRYNLFRAALDGVRGEDESMEKAEVLRAVRNVSMGCATPNCTSNTCASVWWPLRRELVFEQRDRV